MLKEFIENNKVAIITMIRDYLLNQTQNHQNYEVVWKEYQTQVCEVMVEFFNNHGYSEIKVTQTKSTYPEFIVFDGVDLYAFDVKVSIDTQQPAYDIARLDTFEKSRLQKYHTEYEVVIKYSVTSGVVSVYLDELHNIIGTHHGCNGVVKFRPYDGKVRPKSWEDFEKGVSHFSNKQALILGIKAAQMKRDKDILESMKKRYTNEEFNYIIG